jgi:hypothetical protein
MLLRDKGSVITQSTNNGLRRQGTHYYEGFVPSEISSSPATSKLFVVL